MFGKVFNIHTCLYYTTFLAKKKTAGHKKSLQFSIALTDETGTPRFVYDEYSYTQVRVLIFCELVR